MTTTADVRMDVHPKKIAGPWACGFALDDHTLGSTRIGQDETGHPMFDTERSEMGELLHRLKYQGDTSALDPMAEAAADFVRSCDWPVDVIVPVPPSNPSRSVLSSVALAEAVAPRLGVPACFDGVVKVKSTPELKNIHKRKERLDLLNGAFRASESDLAGRKVLLVDDLYRSGATLRSVAGAVLSDGKADTIYALVLTRTRSLR